MIVIVDSNQVAELQVTSGGSRFTGNALHGAAIAEECVGVVVDQLKAGLVEDASGVCLRNSETHGVCEALTKRSGGHFNTRCVVRLWVTWSLAVDLAESLEVVDGEVVAEEVQQSVLEHASMAVGKDEAVTVEPLWVLWVEGHELVEQDVGHWGHSHGRTRVARVGGERGIDLEHITCQYKCSSCRFSGTIAESQNLYALVNWLRRGSTHGQRPVLKLALFRLSSRVLAGNVLTGWC